MLIIIVGVQKTPERREFNVMRVVKRVNNDVDQFMVDNMDMGDVDFDNMFVGHE